MGNYVLQAGTVPVKQLHAVRLARPEDEDRPGEAILMQLVHYQSSQGIVAFTEVDGPGCNHDPHPVRWKDHTDAVKAHNRHNAIC